MRLSPFLLFLPGSISCLLFNATITPLQLTDLYTYTHSHTHSLTHQGTTSVAREESYAGESRERHLCVDKIATTFLSTSWYSFSFGIHKYFDFSLQELELLDVIVVSHHMQSYFRARHIYIYIRRGWKWNPSFTGFLSFLSFFFLDFGLTGGCSAANRYYILLNIIRCILMLTVIENIEGFDFYIRFSIHEDAHIFIRCYLFRYRWKYEWR